MNNLSLKVWEPSSGSQVLEVTCNYENEQNIRLYNPEETKDVMAVLKDKYNNYYVYKVSNDVVEVFTQDGHLVEIFYEHEFIVLDVSKPGFPDARAVLESDIPELMDKAIAINIDERVLRIMNPDTEFEHQSLIIKDPFNLNLIIKEEYL